MPIVVNPTVIVAPTCSPGRRNRGRVPGANKLWINAGNKFVLHTGSANGRDRKQLRRGRGSHTLGLDDIAVCTPTKGFFLYRALGHGNYVADAKGFGIASYGRRAVRFADVNHDGWPDFISVTQTGLTVQLNDHGHFDKSTFSLPLKNGQDAAVGDCDGDGNPDFYVQMRASGSDPDQILFGDGKGQFNDALTVPLRNGMGESVTVLPHWRNGRDAFIVNNGYQNTYGTRQLIACDGTRTLNP